MTEEDRELCARTKRELASRNWPSMDHYADAKTEAIEGILTRADSDFSWKYRCPRRAG